MSSARAMMKSFQQEQAVLTTKVIINEKKEGIVSILGSDDCERTRGGVGASPAASLSLRRTLSADMSSKKWLAQNDFRPIMKKIASSEELPISSSSFSSSSSSSSSSGEEDQEEELQRPGQDEVWMSIQSQKQKQKEEQVKANSNGWTWGSILTQKNDDHEGDSKEYQNQTPYIHPLVKRSTSSLSEKSLEICTESLGSETGSDGFSSYPPSEVGDLDEEKQQQSQQQQQSYNDNNNSISSMEEDLEIKSVNYNYYNNRKIMQSRSFPPPLPSLAAREDGASLHMNCHRQNGRLVLEAVSVPSQNYFHAQRQDGRLLLTLINNPSSPDCEEMGEEDDETEEYARVFDNIEEENEENEDEFQQDQDDEDDDEFEIEEQEEEQMEETFESKRSSEMEYSVPERISRFQGGGGGGVGVGLMNVHKSALVMKKAMAINSNNLTWSPNLNKSVNRMIEFEEEEGEEGDDEQVTAQIPQSLPPPPRLISTAAPPAAAASFNAYEYFWRQQKPSVANIIKQIPPPQQQSLKNKEMIINHQNDAAAARNSKGNHYHHRHHEHKMQNKNNAEYNLVRRCNETRKSLLLWGEPCCIATS